MSILRGNAVGFTNSAGVLPAGSASAALKTLPIFRTKAERERETVFAVSDVSQNSSRVSQKLEKPLVTPVSLVTLSGVVKSTRL